MHKRVFGTETSEELKRIEEELLKIQLPPSNSSAEREYQRHKRKFELEHLKSLLNNDRKR